MEGKTRASISGRARCPYSRGDGPGVGYKDGSIVEIAVSEGRLLTREEPPDLMEMLEQITPDTLHDEFDFGMPQGKEVWQPLHTSPVEETSHGWMSITSLDVIDRVRQMAMTLLK